MVLELGIAPAALLPSFTPAELDDVVGDVIDLFVEREEAREREERQERAKAKLQAMGYGH